MDYVSAYLWEKGSVRQYNPVSVVLQNATVHKKSVLLACVCEGGNEGELGVTESGYFTEGLVEWFHREVLHFLEKKRADEEVEHLMTKEAERMQGEIQQYMKKRGLEAKLHYWMLLLWDNRFWLLSKGNCEGYLVNKRFNKSQLRRLAVGEDSQRNVYLHGSVQRKLGILLCTKGFLDCLKDTQVVEILDIEGQVSEARMEKRLQELWQENIRTGKENDMGAIYIRS